MFTLAIPPGKAVTHTADLKNGWIRLEPGETKNGEGRNFPLTPRLRQVLERQITRTETLQRATGQMIPWLFTEMDGRSEVTGDPG
jgi:integrase